jgi:hypothetical protein
MPYELQFYATDDADWPVRVDLIDDDTGLALDTTDITFAIAVSNCGSNYLTATTADDTIEVPETGTIQWRFTKAQMASLDVRKTYQVGCTMTNAAGTTQLFVGTLAVLNGGFA